MTEADPANIIIHFDVPYHYLLTTDYITALNSFQTTLDVFNEHLFENQVQYEFLTVAVQPGSFKITTAITAIIGVIISPKETISGFLEALTGEETDYEQSGKITALFIAELIKNFYSTPTENLKKIILPEIIKALRAKTDFFRMCIKNRTINAVGFSDKNYFPIQRSDFTHHLTSDTIETLDSEFCIHDVTIISPVDKDVKQKWRFENTTNKSKINAYMHDETFKRNFLAGEYPLKQSKDDDRMTVMIEYKKQLKNGEEEIIDEYVHTVYLFNKNSTFT